MLWEPWMQLDAHIYPWMLDDYAPSELDRLLREVTARKRAEQQRPDFP